MRRYAPLILVGIGVVMLVLSITQVAPPLLNAGITAIFSGLVWFGLSFIPQPEAVSDERPMSAVERLTKIFYSPTEVFRNLRRYPRWFAPLLIMTLAWSIYLFAFTEQLTPKRIVDYNIEKLEQSGFQMPPEAIAEQRKQQMEMFTSPAAKVGGVVAGFGGYFLMFAFAAAIYLLIVLAMGGTINFWQSFSTIIHAWFPAWIINSVLSLIILFLKDPSEIHPILGTQDGLVMDNLGVLMSPATSPMLWALLSSIDALTFYATFLIAIGLKNAGERVSASAGWTAAVIVWILLATLGIVMAALFPSFLS